MKQVITAGIIATVVGGVVLWWIEPFVKPTANPAPSMQGVVPGSSRTPPSASAEADKKNTELRQITQQLEIARRIEEGRLKQAERERRAVQEATRREEERLAALEREQRQQAPPRAAAITSNTAQSAAPRAAKGDFIDYDRISDFTPQIPPATLQLESSEMRSSGTGAVMGLHPFPQAPCFIERAVSLSGGEPTLQLAVRGHLHGDFLARVLVVSHSGSTETIFEQVILGRNGWYHLALMLSKYRNSSFIIRFECHATGWSFEYVALDYFYVLL